MVIVEFYFPRLFRIVADFSDFLTLLRFNLECPGHHDLILESRYFQDFEFLLWLLDI